MNKQTLKEVAISIIKEFPDLKSEIQDLYSLALSEIEEGGSESHECQLAINDMNELVKDRQEETLG
jgi:ERCC4-related helicase